MSHIYGIFAQPPFNIKKEECDPVPMYVANCIDALLLTGCPDKAWNNGKTFEICKVPS